MTTTVGAVLAAILLVVLVVLLTPLFLGALFITALLTWPLWPLILVGAVLIVIAVCIALLLA
jgi:hypothetical protein